MSSPSASSSSLESGSPPPPVVPSLDLTPCLPDDFVNVPFNDTGRYDLVDDILVARDMPNTQHDYAAVRILNWHNAMVTAAIAAGPTTGAHAICLLGCIVVTHTTQRSPDVAIGRPAAGSGVAYPLDRPPPDTVVEITSGNRSTDVGVKVNEYLGIGVRRYVVVDRGMNLLRIYSRGSLVSFAAHEFFNFPGGLGRRRASDLLQPVSPTDDLRSSARDQNDALNRAVEEAERRAEQRRQADLAEAERRAEQANQRARERRRRDRARIRALGGEPETATSSSSSSATPPRRHPSSRSQSRRG